MQLEQRQRLINQFLQLNIQMLEKEIQGQEPSRPPCHSPVKEPCEEEAEAEVEGRQKKM